MWVLCFRRTIESGALAGLASGMGIAVADGFYGAVAAFGLTAISGFLLGQNFWLALAGGGFLLWLGAKTLVSQPASLEPGEQRTPSATGLTGQFFTMLGLTLTNPPTILAFAAVFAGLGLAATTDYTAASLVVAGVFLGSATWWAILALGAGWLRARLGPALARAINVVSGLSILALALWQLAQLA